MTLYYENYKFNQLTIFRLRKAALGFYNLFSFVSMCNQMVTSEIRE